MPTTTTADDRSRRGLRWDADTAAGLLVLLALAFLLSVRAGFRPVLSDL